MRVLIVDDSRAMRLIISRTLRQAGYDAEITEAEHGKDALEKIASNPLELILSDWNMPEMNGLELLTELRASGNTTPFVFVTTEWTPEQVARAEAAGCNGLLAKPFSPDLLADVLARAL